MGKQQSAVACYFDFNCGWRIRYGRPLRLCKHFITGTRDPRIYSFYDFYSECLVGGGSSGNSMVRPTERRSCESIAGCCRCASSRADETTCRTDAILQKTLLDWLGTLRREKLV